jgi:diacylglycerol kinase
MRRQSFWQSFTVAFRGIAHVLRNEPNARFHAVAAVAVLLMAALLKLPPRDWAMLGLTIGAIFSAEMGNSAVESLVDLLSPDYQERAKIAKDVAAGAVLTLAIAAVAVGLCLLGPPLYAALRG